MRIITKQENFKRGCEYCKEILEFEHLDTYQMKEMVVKQEKIREMRREGYLVEDYIELYCNHGKCPYIELDTCSNYKAVVDAAHANVKRKGRVFSC